MIDINDHIEKIADLAFFPQRPFDVNEDHVTYLEVVYFASIGIICIVTLFIACTLLLISSFLSDIVTDLSSWSWTG